MRLDAGPCCRGDRGPESSVASPDQLLGHAERRSRIDEGGWVSLGSGRCFRRLVFATHEGRRPRRLPPLRGFAAYRGFQAEFMFTKQNRLDK